MITNIQPEDWESARPATLQVEVEADTPIQAIDEINDWADQRGYTRSDEWPRPVVVGGRKRFRSVCYLFTSEDAMGAELEQQAVIARRRTMPVEQR